MPQKYSNVLNIPMPYAVLLATDTYDMAKASKKLSATTLLKSTRQIILASRLEAQGGGTVDISDLVSSGIGSTIHLGLEQCWQNPQQALRALGYPEKVISRIRVNPAQPTDDHLNIYTELRTEKPLQGWVIAGSADFIFNGQVCDFKSCGLYAYTSGSNNLKWGQQLSIYRWLNQDKVSNPVGKIMMYLRDWSKLESGYKANYPPHPFPERDIPLMSLPETERFIKEKIQQIEFFWDKDEPELPLCSSDDLWQGKAQWQYFGKSDAQKASKNFDTEPEAIQWRNAKGKGEVRYKPAKAKACTYCDARPLCGQYQSLNQRGLI